MSSTVVVRGAGGALFEVDVPTAGRALDHWNEKLSKGDLVIVEDEVEWADAGQGARQLRVVEKPEPAPARKRAAKSEPKDDAPDSEE